VGRRRSHSNRETERAVVHGHLAVEDEHLGLEPADRFDELGESRGEVAAIPADQAHGTRSLDRDHSPAVDLLLVDPPGAVEGGRDEGRVHEWEGRRGHGAQCNWLVRAGPPSASTD
jgi:hypothetical protein